MCNKDSYYEDDCDVGKDLLDAVTAWLWCGLFFLIGYLVGTGAL